jgi:glycosyltransferase involved in cell wall biosynthesis
MIELVRRVVAAEGLASAMRRARGRVAEAVERSLLLARGPFIRELPHFPILNILATPAVARLGGVQVHLLARLRAERAMRPVALLTPGLLVLSQPRPHARRVTHRFTDAVREAATITGARVLHFEGAYGIPIGGVLQLIDEGFDVILSLHDFALIADDPHHRDAHDETSERRTLGMQLLQRARAVVYPSRFLEREHGRAGTIIPAGFPATAKPQRSNTPHPPRIAIAGNVTARKGAHLIAPIIEALRGRGIEWFLFGGGNATILRSLRALPNVAIHGHYAMGTLPALLAQHNIDVVLLLSIEPELYSLTLSESWLAGAPVIAFAHGAIEERIAQDGGGWLVPLERSAHGIVERIEQWLAGATLPRVPAHIATADDSARAYEQLYLHCLP